MRLGERAKVALSVATGLLAFSSSGQVMAQSAYLPVWPEPNEDSFDWAVEHVDTIPATLVWATADLLVTKERENQVRTGSVVRAWFRWEALSAASAENLQGRSLLVLREMDCTNRRAKILAVTVYPGNNLTGASSGGDRPHGDWVYDRPGQLGAAQTAAACEDIFLYSDEEVRRWIGELSLTE